MSNIDVEFTGNLGNDAEFGLTKNGDEYTRFSVAVTPRIKRDDEWVDGETQWVSVTAWRTLASRAASLAKGTRVTVKGTLTLDEYVAKDGTPRAGLKVNASDITLSLPFVKGLASPSASQSPDEAVSASTQNREPAPF